MRLNSTPLQRSSVPRGWSVQIKRVNHRRDVIAESVSRERIRRTKPVSRSVFDRVQSVLSERAPAPVPHVREREDFPLRGWILSPECRKPVTASPSTNKVGKKFSYYRCHRLNERADTVEAAFIDLLERLAPKQEQMELIERVFRSAWVGRAQTAVTDAAALKRELAKQEARKERVLEQMANGVLSAEDFTRLHASTVKAIADLRERLALAESDVLDLNSAIEYLTHILWNTSLAWQTSDLHGKRGFQRRMFPGGLIYAETGFGTPVTHSIYTLLASDSMDKSRLVAPQGFTDVANKRDTNVFHIIPHAIPHTRNKDSNSDLRTTL